MRIHNPSDSTIEHARRVVEQIETPFPWPDSAKMDMYCATLDQAQRLIVDAYLTPPPVTADDFTFPVLAAICAAVETYAEMTDGGHADTASWADLAEKLSGFLAMPPGDRAAVMSNVRRRAAAHQRCRR